MGGKKTFIESSTEKYHFDRRGHVQHFVRKKIVRHQIFSLSLNTCSFDLTCTANFVFIRFIANQSSNY